MESTALPLRPSSLPRNQLLDQNLTNLRAELDPIKDKRHLDGKWFQVDSAGGLYLYDGPRNCFTAFLEYLMRWFTDRYAPLENRVTEIAQHVQEYLQTETDPQTLSQFLNEYTPAINELYHSAARLKEVGKFLHDIPAFAPNSIVDQACLIPLATSGRVLHSPISGREFMGYSGKLDLQVENQLNQDVSLNFIRTTINEPEHIQSTQMLKSNGGHWNLKWENDFIEKLSLRVEVSSEAPTVVLEQTPENAFKNLTLTIQADGTIAQEFIDVSSSLNQIAITIKNLTAFQVSVDLTGYCNDPQSDSMSHTSVRLPPMQTRVVEMNTEYLPHERERVRSTRERVERGMQMFSHLSFTNTACKEDAILHAIKPRVLFDMQTPLQFGSKNGKFNCVIAPNGMNISLEKVQKVIKKEFSLDLNKNEHVIVNYPHLDDRRPLDGKERGITIVNQSENPLEAHIKVIGREAHTLFRSFSIKEQTIAPKETFEGTYTMLKQVAAGGLTGVMAPLIEGADQLIFEVEIHELASFVTA